MNPIRLSLLLVAAALLPGAAAAAESLRVVTTIPDLADVAREIGGDRADVRSIARGTENIHAVPFRPSDLVAVSRADVFVQMGLSMEHAFVPGLLESASNQRILPGAPGFVNVSEGWEPIDVPAVVSRGVAVDLHPLGNPHFNLDPRAGEHIADRILEGFVRVDPEYREEYEARHAAYLERLAAARKRWDETGKSLRGRKIVTYHKSFPYFARYHGMEVVAEIESKPGVPPKPRDLAKVVETMRENDVRVILTAKWSNNRDVRFVADKAGARVIEAPDMVRGVGGADSWILMMDFLHAKLFEAFAGDE